MRNFMDLDIWKRAHLLTIKIYSITKTFPAPEQFGLTSQMRRSSASVPTNIAEGCGRNSTAELSRFLFIASGSLSELHYQIILSKELGYISEQEFPELSKECNEIQKMIHSYSRKLKPN